MKTSTYLLDWLLWRKTKNPNLPFGCVFGFKIKTKPVFCVDFLRRFWAMSGPWWAYVGPMLALVGPCWALGGYVGAMLGRCWAKNGNHAGLCSVVFNHRPKKNQVCGDSPFEVAELDILRSKLPKLWNLCCRGYVNLC